MVYSKSHFHNTLKELEFLVFSFVELFIGYKLTYFTSLIILSLIGKIEKVDPDAK
jgi:hypothetical protein